MDDACWHTPGASDPGERVTGGLAARALADKPPVAPNNESYWGRF